MMAILLQLISGGVGGNIAGALLKKLNLGPVGNSIAGVIGGVITGQILKMAGSGGVAAATAAASSSGMDMGSILSNVGGAGIGGAVLAAIVGLVKFGRCLNPPSARQRLLGRQGYGHFRNTVDGQRIERECLAAYL